LQGNRSLPWRPSRIPLVAPAERDSPGRGLTHETPGAIAP